MSSTEGLLAELDSYVAAAAEPILVILGPTAAGKTAVSIQLAKRYDGAVINADSRQMYSALTIGTGAVTPGEQMGIEHYLLQVRSPTEEVTVGWFQREAFSIIQSLHTNKQLPIVCGGSMLYISSIIDNLTLAPQDETVRSRLNAEYDADNGKTLYTRLQETDPQTAAGIHQSNKPYVVRALEIIELTKQKRSDTFSDKELRKNKKNEQNSSSYEPFIIGITRETEVLNSAINNRVEAMMTAGWIEEVQQLLAAGIPADAPAFKSVGYQEIAGYLQNPTSAALHELTDNIKTKTRRYARRQRSWWRRDERIHWAEAADLLTLL